MNDCMATSVLEGTCSLPYNNCWHIRECGLSCSCRQHCRPALVQQWLNRSNYFDQLKNVLSYSGRQFCQRVAWQGSYCRCARLTVLPCGLSVCISSESSLTRFVKVVELIPVRMHTPFAQQSCLSNLNTLLFPLSVAVPDAAHCLPCSRLPR